MSSGPRPSRWFAAIGGESPRSCAGQNGSTALPRPAVSAFSSWVIACGKNSVNLVPPPGVDCTSTSPSCSWTMRKTIERPMPLPFSLVVKYRSKMRGRFSGGMPTPVSSTDRATRRREATAAARAKRAAVGHRLQRVDRQVQHRLHQHALVGVDVRQGRCAHSSRMVTRRRCASGAIVNTTSWMTVGSSDRLQLQLVGPGELEEPGDHLVQPLDLARDDVHVLRQVELARRAARRAPARRSVP